MNVKEVRSFETSGMNNGSTQSDRAEDLNPRCQSRGNLKHRTKSLQGPCATSHSVDGVASHLSICKIYSPEPGESIFKHFANCTSRKKYSINILKLFSPYILNQYVHSVANKCTCNT
jgi:hypothetical protein